MEERDITIRVFDQHGVLYLNVLGYLRAKVCWSFDKDKEFIAPFVITCAAALECMLNDCLISEFSWTEEQRTQVPGYLSMTLRGKLTNVVPIVSSGRFVINQAHRAFRDLAELIQVRNRLVHNRSSYEDHAALVTSTPEGGPLIKIDPAKLERAEDYSFGIPGDVGRFHDALVTLHEKFFDVWDHDDFTPNELVLAVVPAKKRVSFRVKE